MDVVSFHNLESFFDVHQQNGTLKDLTQIHEGHDPLTFCLTFNHEKALGLQPEQWSYLIKNSSLHHNFSLNKHALVLYFKNRKDQCLDLTEELVSFLIDNTRLRVPYKGAWSAAEHFLYNRAKQDITLTEQQFESLMYKSDVRYVGKDGFNLLKSLIASHNEKAFVVSKDLWTYMIENSDLLTSGSKGYTPLMDACACTSSFEWDESHWEYLLKNSNLNHQNVDGKTALMLAMMNTTVVKLNHAQWEYFFRNTNLKLRDKDTQDVFGYANPSSEQYALFESLNQKYVNTTVASFDMKKVIDLQSTLSEKHGLVDAKSHTQYVVDLISAQPDRKHNVACHMRMLFIGNSGTGKGLVAEHMCALYQTFGLTMATETSKFGNSFFYYKNADFNADFQDLRGRTIYYKYSTAKDEKDLEPSLLGLFNTIGESTLFILGMEPKDVDDFRVKCPRAYALFTKKLSFPDYTEHDLLEMTKTQLLSSGFEITGGCADALTNYFKKKISDKQNNCQNGNLVQATCVQMIEAYYRTENSACNTSTVPSGTIRYLTEHEVVIPVVEQQEQSVNTLLDEFDTMVGLESVKKNLRKLVALTKANQLRGKESTTTLHLVFTGNPGTGKTTVARMVGRIYKTLGLLPQGHVVETDRSGLVSGYIGQTALKTKETVQRALGGVLFIDEAYALTTGDSGRQDFGKESVETLLKLMEDHRKDFAVIVAGYPEEMKNFIEMNPGLKSRFSKTLVFDDYTMPELLNIFEGICKKEGFTYTPEVVHAVEQHLTKMNADKSATPIGFVHQAIVDNKDHKKYFGNAREVRTIYEDALEHQALRLMLDERLDPWAFIPEDIAAQTEEAVANQESSSSRLGRA